MKVKLKFDAIFYVKANSLSGAEAYFGRNQYQFSCWGLVKTLSMWFVVKEMVNLFWDSTFLYGNPSFSERKFLWERIQNLQLDAQNLWLCIGHFN